MSPKQHPVGQTLLRLFALLALYFLGGVLLQKSFQQYEQVNLLFWPPFGLSLVVVFTLGWRFWPGVAVGTFLFALSGGVPFGCFMMALVLGNTLAALGCHYLLRRWLRFESSLERVRDVGAFVLVVCGFGATFNAALNAVGLACEHKIVWEVLLPNVLAWWVPNTLAALIFSPVYLVWARPSLWRWNFRHTVEGLLCGAGLVVSTLVSFAAWFLYGIHDYPLAYLPVPFLLWATIRFGPRGAASGTLVAAALIFYFLFHSHGLSDNDLGILATFGGYTGALAVLNLLLAAVVAGRRRAEINLAENEKRMRTVVADQSDLICRFQPDGKITFVNPAFCEFHGESEAELLGTDFFQRLKPAEVALLRENLATLPEDRPIWSFDRRSVAADDHVEWQQYNLRRFASDGGKGFEYQVVIQNITSRKQAEFALQEAKTTLEKMNLQLQLSVKEANAAADQANRANAAKSEFLANMSHEIRTPLSGILGMVELLSQSRLDARQQEFATAATQSANALLHVINDVLDFSKIEAGKMTIAQEEFSLRDIVDSVLENAAAREPEKKISLAAIIRRDVPRRLTGDAVRLRQVLLNLVSNGIKFTEQGEVVVRVQLQNHAAGRLKLRFEITDTGIGLAPEQTKKLFQPFMQGDTTSSRKFGGTGLGLAISRKVVELMGGRIGVQSAVGVGSTFWFELPFTVPEQPAVERSFPGLVFANAVIAAPNASLRESLAERLRGWGMDCRDVGTVKDLFRVLEHDLRSAVLPVVLCDEEMLALGGDQLRQRLAAHQERLQCILLVGPTAMLDNRENDPTQFASVLLKPIREQSLFDALVNVVSEKKPEALRPVHLPGDTEMIQRPVAAKQTPVSKLRILAADDHPFNRRLWQLMLDNFGARADWVENGREAVEKFQPGRYDAILMDCNMPELDGHEATAAIRHIELENQVSQPVRIIAITANALVGERERCLAAGMDDYLAKPFTAEQLYQSLLVACPERTDTGDGFDPDKIERLCDELGRTAAGDMAGDFLNELPDRLGEIHRLYTAGQWPDLKRAAHSLKGLYVIFGFRQLSAMFETIEQAASAADAAGAGAALKDLDAQAEQAMNRLRDWLKTSHK